MISKKLIGSVLAVVLVILATPTCSYAKAYSNEDMGQVSVSVDESISKHYDELGLDIQSEKVKDKIKDKKVIVDNRNNKDIIEQSYIEPVVIYEEEFTIDGYTVNKQNRFQEADAFSTLVSPSATALTWVREAKSSNTTVTYKGTYVTASLSMSADVCYDAPGISANDKLMKLTYYIDKWSSTNGLDAGDSEYYFNDYNGGYVNIINYKYVQAGYSYNGHDGSLNTSGTDTFSWWRDTGECQHLPSADYCWIKGNAGLVSGYAIFNFCLYGGTQSDFQIYSRTLNVGWGEIVTP